MNLKKIINEVCGKYGTSEEELKSDRRLQNIVLAKKVIWKILVLSGKSTTQIGNMFGKDHSTICVGLQGLSKFPDDYEYAVKLYMKYRDAEDLNPSEDHKSYAKIIREEIKKCLNKKMSIKQIAEKLSVSEKYVEKESDKIRQKFKIIPDYKTGTYSKIYI